MCKLVSFTAGNNINMFRTIAAIIFTVTISPIYFSFLFILVVYRKCINLILAKKFGNKYGGLLDGDSTIWAVYTEPSKTVMNFILMVDFSAQNFYSIFKAHLKTRIFDKPRVLPKFTSICKNAYGYNFLLNNEYGIDECVRELEEHVKDERDLLEVVGKYADNHLPKNHTALWEMLVCKSSIKWRNSNCCPVILRCNHAVADGINLLNMLATVLGDEGYNLEETPSPTFSLRTKLFELYLIILYPFHVFTYYILNKNVSNSLFKKLSDERLFTWKIEDGDTLAKIKKIKNKIPQTTFMDVLITAISASYEEHFAKSGPVPSDFSLGYVVNNDLGNTLGNISGRYRPPVLTNNFTLPLLETPIRWNAKPLVEKLKVVTRRRKLMLENHTMKKNYYLLHVFSQYLPRPIMRTINGNCNFTVAVSNLAGTPYWTMCGGHLVRDMIGLSIQLCTSGMTLILLTYGGERMQLSLSADKVLFNSVDEMNGILNGITKYVNKLDEELNCDLINNLN